MDLKNWKPLRRGRFADDLTGKKFDRLTVVRMLPKKRGKVYFLCRCECGKEKEVRSAHLKSGNTRSCGCFSKDHLRAISKTHGMTKTWIFNLWRGIKGRTLRKSDQAFENYGGRGITMYEPWIDNFEKFRDDIIAEIGERPPGHSLDRIKNDGNYEPGNIRWATQLEQNRNMRTNVLLTANGVTKALKDWADEFGITPPAIQAHLRKGRSFDSVHHHFTHRPTLAE